MLRNKNKCLIAVGYRFTMEGYEVINRNVKELHQTGIVTLNFTYCKGGKDEYCLREKS